MAELEAASDVTLHTDFAILSADQPPAGVGAASYMQSYAASAPGSVNMMAGTKYAEILIRLERWTGRPSDVFGWEDCDELPWRTLPGDRVLGVSGFEDANGDPLPLGELESGRVRVSARGRHRYAYGEIVASLPPEEWLVQLWPEPGDVDPLAGPPRRIGQPWREPLRAWHSSGWYAVLSAYGQFFAIRDALGRFPDGFTQASIAADWVATRFRNLEPTRWEDPTSAAATSWGKPATGERRRVWVSEFAASRGLPPLDARDDLWTLMVDVGMFTARADGFVVSNPAVSAVDDPSMPADVLEEVRVSQAEQLEVDAEHFAGDIRHLVGWSTNATLVTSPAKIAARYNVDVDLVITAVRSPRLTRHCRVEPDFELIGADSVVSVRPKYLHP